MPTRAPTPPSSCWPQRVLGEVPDFFSVESFQVNVERRYNAIGELVTVSEAIVKVRVGDEVLISAAEGNGPVNALDLALRKDLGNYQRYIADLELVDYKVRIFQGGTDAVTRVLIESGDGDRRALVHGRRLPNIIDASFQALIELDHLPPRHVGRGSLTGRTARLQTPFLLPVTLQGPRTAPLPFKSERSPVADVGRPTHRDHQRTGGPHDL